MFPRWVTVAVIFFWVAMTAWLFYRDLRPRLLPGQPPPFTFDLADEAKDQFPTRWTVYQNGDDRGYARTQVLYREDSATFEMHGEFKLWLPGENPDGPKRMGFANVQVKNVYQVTREGDLREMRLTFKLQKMEEGVLAEAEITGRVENEYLTPTVTISIPPGFSKKLELEPVKVAQRASVLNPLQPLNRLPNLRKGQKWRIPLVDPLPEVWQVIGKLLPGILGKPSGIQFLDAEVLPETQVFRWEPHTTEVACLVIEYSGDDVSARTWVRESDGLVLCQEVTQHGVNLKLVRD